MGAHSTISLKSTPTNQSKTATMVQNKGVIFKQIPQGLPVPGKDLAVEAREFDIDQAPPKGGVTTKNFYASFDPYQRGRMRDANKKSYSPPYTLGEPIGNGTVAKVIKSDNEKFAAGDLVVGMIPTEEYSALPQQSADALRKVDNPYNLDLKVFIGALGIPGLTAYSSLYEIGKPQKGETIFVSSAAGAVGQLVGQLAKHEGLRVIGSVGSDEKLQYIKSLGFDDGFNYKSEKPLDALKRLAPEGIDIYYENVGGEQLQAAIECLNKHGRIVACGMISDYNARDDSERYCVTNLMQVVGKQLTMRGFLVGDADMGPKWAQEHQEKVRRWLKDGTFKARTHVWGIQEADKGFVGMLRGENLGKA